ncbi:MAG: hypothetical protein RMK29_21515 [Myxococcales bacterium]|nr:hypothetical protein [Myxococcota bacterium]MDW8284291.1 hypothetical protein [Myxococcales bacterium]
MSGETGYGTGREFCLVGARRRRCSNALTINPPSVALPWDRRAPL